jgi:AraC-like DNA-binding protein
MAMVRCVFAMQLNLDKNHSCGEHVHHCTEIIAYLEGTGILLQNGKKNKYRSGMISVYQPNSAHTDVPNSAGVQVCIGVTGCGAEKLPQGIWTTDKSIRDCYSRIIAEMQSPANSNKQERLDILAGWLVLELRRIIQNRVSTPKPTGHADNLKKIIDSRFNETIDFQQLADSLYISPSYLRQIFKQSTGESPLNYLIRRRLDMASELLKITDLPIGEIARRVGLDNAYYFSRIFRKRLGMTPSAYRKQVKKQP